MIEVLEESFRIVRDGGWLMVPLVLVAFVAYGFAFNLLLFFKSHPFYKTSSEELGKMVLNPVHATGELRDLIDYVRQGSKAPWEIRGRFRELYNLYLDRIDRQQRVIFALITIAPLMGLLGTVGGMLATFRGISLDAAGQTVDLIAGGIAEALITTQTGLFIAIPGYVFLWLAQRRRNKMAAFLNSFEIMTVILLRKEHNASAA